MDTRSLSELQAQFFGALFSASEAPDHLMPEDSARFSIYRAAVQRNLGDALRAVFPVVERLTGKEFFDYAARRYIAGHPSESGDLHRYGVQFPAFLADFDPAATLPYLPDVARLEWLWHEAFHAQNHRPADFSELAAIPATRWPQLRPTLQAGCRLLQSAYPVQRIWQINQPGHHGDDSVNLDAGGVSLLVFRAAYEVAMAPLTAGRYAFLKAAMDNASMTDALEAALAHEPGLDVAAMLRQLVTDEIVVRIDDESGELHKGEEHAG